jgi:hypothetical protein
VRICEQDEVEEDEDEDEEDEDEEENHLTLVDEKSIPANINLGYEDELCAHDLVYE